MTYRDLASRLARVREEIARVQARQGLHEAVTIVAVTKGFGADAVRAAVEVGLTDVGENRVQEALDKIEAARDVVVQWHLIGHLQTNKARFVPGRFAMVHSVDSPRVAAALARANAGVGLDRLPVLLQVNVAGEVQKSGCAPADVAALAEAAMAAGSLHLRGLMTMAPYTDDETIQRRTFAQLRRLREELASRGLSAPELSMGMSGDYAAAVAEGATMLRLGTVLFGERPT